MPVALVMFAAIATLAPAATAVAAEPITFAIKFPAGEIDHQTATMDTEQTFSGIALPAPEKDATKMSLRSTFKGIMSDATGSQVELTYDGVKMSMSNLGQDLSTELDKTLAAIVGAKVLVHFTPDGKVDKVDGVEAMVAKFPPGQAQAGIKQFLNGERIKDGFNIVVGLLLPTTPVNVGDTWETNVSQKMSKVEVKIKSTVKLVGIDEREGHKIAKLEFSGSGKIEPPATGIDPTMKIDRFDQNGTAEFDLTRGWITSQNLEQHMKGDIRLNSPGNTPTWLKIDQTVKATTTLTAAKAEATSSDSTKAPKPEPVKLEPSK